MYHGLLAVITQYADFNRGKDRKQEAGIFLLRKPQVVYNETKLFELRELRECLKCL